MKKSIAAIALAVPILLTAACAETTTGTDTGSSDASQSSSQGKPKKVAPKYTSSQKAAIGAAQNYVDMMPFSRKGLIDQLSSEYGDQFPRKDAVFAVNHIKVDWNKEAVEAAKNYKDTMPMSKQAMIDQLSSPHGDKFTKEQAIYGVEQAY